MKFHRVGAFRNGPEIPLATIIGTGVFGTIAFAYLVLARLSLIDGILPEGLLEVLVLGIPALGLLFAGFWLATGDFNPSEIWTIGSYAITAVVIAAFGVTLGFFVFQLPGLGLREAFFLYISTGTEGAFFGVLLGAVRLTDVLQKDITEAKRREQELERVNVLFDQAQEIANIGAWETDLQNDEGWWTEQVNHIYGLPADYEPDPGEGIEYFHPKDQPVLRDAFERAKEEGEPYDLELRVVSDDGTLRWVRARAKPKLEDGEVVRVRGTLQDITASKKRERELQRQNERLDEFASIVSHDLRNPLNVAQGRIDLAREECESGHLDDAGSAVDRSLDLIEDMLTLARAGEQVGEIEPVDVANLVHTCWKNVQTSNATIDADLDATIQADQSRFRQLLENLFRNAVEHGGDDVTVSVGGLDDGFYIEDDGPGIPETDREDVFEAGFSTSEGGSGFGLSIVKQIVKAHNWEIHVTEGSDGGARFEITGVEFTAE